MQVFHTKQVWQPQQPQLIYSRHTEIPNRNCQSDGLGHRNNFSPKRITTLRKLTRTAKFISWAVLQRSAPNPSLIHPGQPASCLWQWPVLPTEGQGTAKLFLIPGVLLFPLSCTGRSTDHTRGVGSAEERLSCQNFSIHSISLLSDPSEQTILKLKEWL